MKRLFLIVIAVAVLVLAASAAAASWHLLTSTSTVSHCRITPNANGASFSNDAFAEGASSIGVVCWTTP
jgi:hypothetical protein